MNKVPAPETVVVYFDGYQRAPLSGDSILSDIGITDLSTIHLRTRIRGGMPNPGILDALIAFGSLEHDPSIIGGLESVSSIKETPVILQSMGSAESPEKDQLIMQDLTELRMEIEELRANFTLDQVCSMASEQGPDAPFPFEDELEKARALLTRARCIPPSDDLNIMNDSEMVRATIHGLYLEIVDHHDAWVATWRLSDRDTCTFPSMKGFHF